MLGVHALIFEIGPYPVFWRSTHAMDLVTLPPVQLFCPQAAA
jgi:hypothetical protein